MALKTNLTALVLAASAAMLASSARAAIVISEVDSAGSSASYAGDWFELTNTGASAVSITGYTMDDNSNLVGNSVALHDVTSIAAGKSVIFIEATTTSAYDATLAATEIANFKAAWFSSNVPADFTIGSYGGQGVGLSSTSDAVNLFDSTGAKVTGVNFGVAPTGATFDNSLGSQTGANNPTLVTPSSTAIGAFTAANGAEVGSPGALASTPEPVSASIALLGLGLMARRSRKRA